MAIVYKGIARGNVTERGDNASLPEGTRIEISIKQEQVEETAAGNHPKGSSMALLAALKVSPRCTSKDVEALIQSMQQGKQPV